VSRRRARRRPEVHAPCKLCGRHRRARRGACWSCYDKFRDNGVDPPVAGEQLDPPGRPGPAPLDPHERLARDVLRWTPEARAKLLRALADAGATAPVEASPEGAAA
jgi:hypothetical protein